MTKRVQHRDGDVADEDRVLAKACHERDGTAAEPLEEPLARGGLARRFVRWTDEIEKLDELGAQTLDRESPAGGGLPALELREQHGATRIAPLEPGRIDDERAAACLSGERERTTPSARSRGRIEAPAHA